MARKKIIFVIVEGISEDTALGVILSRIYDKSTVHVEITRGDITSDKGVTAANVIARTAAFVRHYAAAYHLKKGHFQRIIHLLDTDGAYIPDDRVIEDATYEKPQYSETDIRTANRDGILKRNARKRAAMDRLAGQRCIWDVPYQAYYMSSNLDHVLHGKQNSTDEEKESDAYAFAKKYKDSTAAFLAFLRASNFSVGGTYIDSWRFIRQELHSLERYTNFGLCFPDP